MNEKQSNRAELAIFGLCVLTLILLLGCSKKEVSYYETESTSETETSVTPAAKMELEAAIQPKDHGHPVLELGKWHWETPENWIEVPAGTMVQKKFSIGRAPQVLSEMAISVFPGDVGGKLANLNRWRRQVGLSPVDESLLPDFINEFTVSGSPAWMADVSGPATADSPSTRIVVTAVETDGQTWFFKLQGEEAGVASAFPGYHEFIRSISIH